LFQPALALDMNTPHAALDIFLHVRIMVGMIVGLSVARLLTGMARFIQHPKRQQVYPVHLGWAFAILLSVIHFWWWEFRLEDVPNWSFEEYACLLLYTILFFLLSTLLFPDNLEEYKGFRDYFISRKGWFFALLALTFLVDVWDTLLKGKEYAASLGVEYTVRAIAYPLLCLLAIFIDNQRFQVAFVALSLLYQVSWILRLYHRFP
jgi:hypothetical protein